MEYYNKKLLKFLYELTKLKKFMSHKEISSELAEREFKISPKTVERWFKFLNKPYKHEIREGYEKYNPFPIFNFFPTFFYEKLGLASVYLILEEPKRAMIKSFPFQKYNDYATWLFDSSKLKSVLLLGFVVPINKIDKFKESYSIEKKKGTLGNFEIYITNKSFNIYSPWNKVISKNGLFHPEKNDLNEIELQIDEFNKYLNNLPKIEMIPEIKNNPLIIPPIFEQHRAGWSSSKIWEKLRERLKEEVWDYFKKKKKKTDSVGIKRIQSTMRDINNLGLMHKMKVFYMPLELGHNFYVYSNIRFNNRKELLESVKKLAINSVWMAAYPMKENELFLINLINNKSLPTLLDIFSEKKVKRVFFLQHEKSLSLF